MPATRPSLTCACITTHLPEPRRASLSFVSSRHPTLYLTGFFLLVREPSGYAYNAAVREEARPRVELYQWLPADAGKILLVLFFSFLIGLEREEHKTAAGGYSFGGVRTFPLIGLIGYSLSMLSGAQMVPVALGFFVVAGFLLLSYWHKLSRSEVAGITSEMSGLTT